MLNEFGFVQIVKQPTHEPSTLELFTNNLSFLWKLTDLKFGLGDQNAIPVLTTNTKLLVNKVRCREIHLHHNANWEGIKNISTTINKRCLAEDSLQ